MKTKFFLLLTAIAIQVSHATMIATVEAPGVQQTTVANTTAVSFNLLATGMLGSYSSSIGTYSAGATIVSPDAYGGANDSQYVSIGAQSGTFSYSLSFFGPVDYFGFNWQAADNENSVSFYRSGQLVQTFTTADIFGSLGADYDGNPNTGANKAEKYAFVNFFGANGTLFDQVVFNNKSGWTGFETDNHTIRENRIPGSEVATPEPSTYALCGIALLTVGFYRRRKATPAKM